jgi:hypothetical protein
LQKCIKTKNFNSLWNQHLQKTGGGEGGLIVNLAAQVWLRFLYLIYFLCLIYLLKAPSLASAAASLYNDSFTGMHFAIAERLDGPAHFRWAVLL